MRIVRDYPEKLLHNYHELTHLERLWYWLVDRRRSYPQNRFFFEGCASIPGQMYIADRKAIYNTILNHKPTQCFEIGTYMGGGSTYFLASAFAKLGRGKVITMEADEHLFDLAQQKYRRYVPELLPYIEFIKGDATEDLLPAIKANSMNVPCFLLDGSDDSTETVRQFMFFKNFLTKGAVMMVHDWNTDKMRDLKPIIENASRWTVDTKLGLPESVGFLVCSYR